MGISLFIGEEDDSQEFRLSNSEWYSKFLDHVATKSPAMENLLHFAPDLGHGIKGHTGPVSTEEVSLEKLKEECTQLLEDSEAPEYVTDIAQLFIEAIDLADAKDEVLTIE